MTADDGLFTFDDLNFGDIFGTGADRWIELSVRQGTGGTWTILGPRTPVTSVPTADVARQLALPYADVANVGDGQAAFQIENTDPLGWSIYARSGPSSGLTWNSATAIFDVAETGPLFGLITAGTAAGIAGAGIHPGTNGLQAERYSANPTGSALFVFDLADGNDARFGTSDYSGDFSGPVRFLGAMDISGEEIDSTEISNEPGIAGSIPGSFVTVGTSTTNAAVRTITVPAAGFVLALANCDIQMSHTSGGGQTFVNIGVSDIFGSIPTDQDQLFRVPAASATGLYNTPGSAHGVFSVNAGSNTFYMVTNGSSAGSNNLFDINFTLIYFPTAYGVVNATLPPPPGDPIPESQDTAISRPGLTYAEIEAEYHAELARHMAVLDAKQREIETLMIEMNALRARVQPSIVDLPASKRED